MPRINPAGLGRPAAAGMGIAVLALAGCGTSSAPRVALPSRPAHRPSAPVRPAAKTGPAAARQQVIAAYTGSWRAYAQAFDSRNAGRARALMAPYFDAWQISQLLAQFRVSWSKHRTGYGGAVNHVLGVSVHRSTATVHDCLNLSHFGMQDWQTGAVLPESFGPLRWDMYVSLARSAGRWRVVSQVPVQVPCSG